MAWACDAASVADGADVVTRFRPDSILALSQDADWVSSFYSLDTPELIAEHLAWNCGLQNRDLSQLDGFADREDADVTARVVDVEYETEEMP